MPVEIRELNIKVSIDESSSSSGTQSAGTGTATTNSGQPDEALISAIVEKVLEILKAKTER